MMASAKSSFALGYARATENVTIHKLLCDGNYQLGTLLDGTFKALPEFKNHNRADQFGTESTEDSKTLQFPTACLMAVADWLGSVERRCVRGHNFRRITMRDLKIRRFSSSRHPHARPKDAPVGKSTHSH